MGEVSIPYAVVGAQARQRGCRFPRSALIDRAEERWHDGDRDSTPFRRPVRTAAFTNSRGTVKLRCNAYPPGSRRTASCTAGRRRGSRIRVWPSGPFSTTDCAAALSVGAALRSGRRALRRIAAAGSSSGHEPTTKASCRLYVQASQCRVHRHPGFVIRESSPPDATRCASGSHRARIAGSSSSSRRRATGSG